MKSILILMMIVQSFAAASPQADCPCKKDPKLESGWVGHMTNVFSEPTLLKSIEGAISDPSGSPLLGVGGMLIEIFDHPEGSPYRSEPQTEAKQERVAACRIEKGGKFCFPAIPEGRYEMRFYATGFNPTVVFIHYAPTDKRSKRKAMSVIMMVGT